MTTTLTAPPPLRDVEPISQVDQIHCVSIAWTELLRITDRLDLTPDEALTYASALHADVVAAGTPDPDVFTVGEALRRRGLIAGMRLAKTVDGVLEALTFGPVVCMLPWRHGLIYPRSGVVATIAGDGEFEDNGCELLHSHVLVDRHAHLERRGVTRADDVVEFRASMGRRWAHQGTGYIRVADLCELLAYTRALPGFGFLAAGPVWPEEAI